MCNITERYDKMYEFENKKDLYHFRFKDTGLPMWMFVRLLIIEGVAYNTGYSAKKQISRGKLREKEIQKNILQKYVMRNPYLSRKKDIVFAFWGFQELRQHDDGMVYEDFIMPFLRIFPHNTTTVMEGRIRNRYELDCAHPNWKMADIFTDIIKYKEVDVSTEDQKQIRGFINFLECNCPFQIESSLKKDICAQLNYFAKYAKLMIKMCELYLQIVKPKVVIIFCASYPGILRTPMIMACKNKKVVTAELQHGWVGEYNPNTHICNYIIKNKEFNRMMPDYFLTFGKYWNSQVRATSKCNVIGYTKPIIEDAVPVNNKILFCAGLHFETYMELLDGLMSKLDFDTEIYFRFHPTYSSQEQKNLFKKYLKYPNFIAADKKDLGDYMKECRYVIVDGSTIAYEALFMGRIVFALESELSIKLGYRDIPDVHMFRDAIDFMELWNERSKLKPVYHKEFFDLNYKENYIRILKKCGVDVIGK